MKRDLIVIAGLLIGLAAGTASYQYFACKRFVPKQPAVRPTPDKPQPKPKPRPCPD